MKNRDKLIESGLRKIYKKVLKEETGKKWLSRKQYAQARKGIEMLLNSLFDLSNISHGDPDGQEKRRVEAEVRKHVVAIREIIDKLV